MIPLLPAASWREFRGTPPKTGTNQTVHLATVEDGTGKLHRCYVKMCPSHWMTPITESVAWILSAELSLPRPQFAALILVPLDKLSKHLKLDQHWLGQPQALAFCASAVDGKSPTQGWQWLAPLRTKRMFKRPEIARIAAFDLWADNQDRNTSNVLIERSGNCIPIDNELIL